MSVKAFTISEYPLDSIIGNSEQSQYARTGILEYIEKEKPDVIFIDGLCSRIKNLEAYIEGMDEPLKNLMEGPFQMASEFLQELKNASPSTEIYLPLSDADEDNIRSLTKYTALEEAAENRNKIKEHRANIDSFTKQIKAVEKQKKQGWYKKAESLRKRKESCQNEIKDLSKRTSLPKPGSPRWTVLKEKASWMYVNKLKDLNPGVNVVMGNIDINVNGYSFLYSHNFHETSDVSLTSRTNRLLRYVDKLKMGGSKLPDFIIESGHHGESMGHPYRHGERADAYSLIFTSMVMEDQKVVRGILDGKIMPERFQGKTNNIEACKRHSKKNHLPSPGISLLEKTDRGFLDVTKYELEHLAKVGAGEIKPINMNNLDEVEEIVVLSDIHIGKGNTRLEKLESAIEGLKKEIEERAAKKQSAPIVLMLNESLQGRNYKTMVVETKRSTPTKFKRRLESIIEEGESIIIEGKEYLDMGSALKLGKEGVNELERTNDPHLLNQLEDFIERTNDWILGTLSFCKYNPAIVYTEGTHIQHTVGEYGITEAGLQSLFYRMLSLSVPYLQKIGELKKNTKLRGIDKKMLVCEEASGFVRFDLELGGLVYKVSAGHKPGSATPSSNIPGKHIQRATTMADDSDMHFAGHLHTPYFVSIGGYEQNTISTFYKGGTFNEYDSYGREKGWGPPIIGYIKAIVPKKEGYKGVYKARFVTSDVL